jgi:hypothetical protein
MRALTDVLATDPDTELADVPLLATYQGDQVFTAEPVVALDPLLADTGRTTTRSSTLTVISGDFHEALNLVGKYDGLLFQSFHPVGCRVPEAE